MRGRRLLGVLLIGAGLALARPSPSASAETPRLLSPPGRVPSLLALGPYGSPLALSPPGLPDLSVFRAGAGLPGIAVDPGHALLERERTGAAVPPAAAVGGVAVSGDPNLWLDERDNDLPAARPGALGRGRVKPPDPVPDQTGKAHRSPTALVPDYEIPIGPRASVGGFGEIGRLQIDPQAGLLPGVKARDVGGGVTLQYRFGE